MLKKENQAKEEANIFRSEYKVEIATFDPDDLPDRDDVIERVKDAVTDLTEFGCAVRVSLTSAPDVQEETSGDDAP